MLDDVPGGTVRVFNVRSAEIITSYNKLKGISYEELSALAVSCIWQECLVAGWTIRELCEDAPKGSQELIKRLAEDPFCDENGNYLVRESTGVYEEQDECSNTK
jgi:hypothetical protein